LAGETKRLPKTKVREGVFPNPASIALGMRQSFLIGIGQPDAAHHADALAKLEIPARLVRFIFIGMDKLGEMVDRTSENGGNNFLLRAPADRCLTDGEGLKHRRMR